LVDSIREKAWRCKCKFKKILPLKEKIKLEGKIKYDIKFVEDNVSGNES
jgi:hypothetical protein